MGKFFNDQNSSIEVGKEVLKRNYKISAALPILGVLHGEHDFSGRHHLLKISSLCELIIVSALVIWFEIEPQQAISIYNITDPSAMLLAERGLRIFALSFILRSLCITFMYYLQIIPYRYFGTII